MRRLALALCLALAACGLDHQVNQSVGTFPPPAPRSSTPVVVTKLVDLRPERLRAFHEPGRSKAIGGLFGAYFFLGWVRSDGPRLWGDERTTIAVGGAGALPPVQAAARFVERVVKDAAGGNATTVAAAVDAANVDGAAALAPGGEAVVVVPLLDELDQVQLESESEAFGGSSSTEDHGTYTTTTTRTGGWGNLEHTPTFGNARIRLALLRVHGGKVVARHVVYAAGAEGEVAVALELTGGALARGVVAFLAANP